ncbi:MAG: glucose-6-phosphate dehydrogenase [Acidimicrobiales bacterium]|nr:glucose-6-phosphate dehydrogenase [Acidimicrobiales bacterium]
MTTIGPEDPSDPRSGAALPNPLSEGLTMARKAPPLALVIFGASGDLTSRKLLPALAALADRHALGRSFTVIGVARTPMDDVEFRKVAARSVEDPSPEWEAMVRRFRYVSGDYGHPDTFAALSKVLSEVDQSLGTAGNRLYYLATVPDLFAEVAGALSRHGLATPPRDDAFCRLVVEKPFGRDGRSAQALDDSLHEAFFEEQIYRIDHYLGKETVQNVLALRFANAIFEPVWNRRYVDHIQVTVAEDLGVEHRGGFYETAGALRDIVQNHVMQLLGLTLMEPPGRIDAEGIRDEKVKALRAVVTPRPKEVAGEVVRGQYDGGWVAGSQVVGYREEEGVDPGSHTETYVGLRLDVDNWRWAGVPIFVRTGKRLPKRITEVALVFHKVPHLSFPEHLAQRLMPNVMVLRIQPDEGISLSFGAKVPGQEFRVASVSMDFTYGASFVEESPDAYERLLLDAMVGDPTLFIRSDEVSESWRIVDPLLQAFGEDQLPLARYAAGSWGPVESDLLLERTDRHWRKL